MKTLQQLVETLGQAPTLPDRRSSDAPMVTVQMTSGARYEGSIREHSSEIVILAGMDGARHFLDPARIEAITISDCLALRDVLDGEGSQQAGELRRAG